MAKTYTKDDRKAIRSGESYPLDLIERIIYDVLNMTVQSFETHPYARKKPNSIEVGNTYIFRHCLCGYLLALDWIGKGGSSDVRPEKIRNDVVDANFAAYATFFDGFFSADRKAVQIYEEAIAFLDAMGIIGEAA